MNPLDFIVQDWENDQYRPHRPGFGTPHGPLDNGGEDQEESFDVEDQQDRQF